MKKLREKTEPIFHRIVYAFVGCCIFLYLGWIIPNLYLTYFDGAEYYTAKFISLDKTIYKPCDTIVFTIHRDSKVKSGATFSTSLFRITETGQRIPIARRSGPGDITLGEQGIANTIVIPCDAPEGNYTIGRVVIYRVYDREKTFSYQSPEFLITK